MRVPPRLKFIQVALFCMMSAMASLTQEPGCAQIALRGKMASARSGSALDALRKEAGVDHRNELVFAARRLELNPKSKTAADGLLSLLPKCEWDPDEDDPIRTAWLDIAGLEECESGGLSDRDLMRLFALQYRLPRLLAKAVLISPGKLPQLLARTQLFITPDSDFTIQMQAVCRKEHRKFLDAVDKFSPKDKQWFLTKIFNPDSCRAIFLPEQ